MALAAHGEKHHPVLSFDHALARCYNRTSMHFAHGLFSDPLFGLKSLTQLAVRCAERANRCYLSNGVVGPQDTWESGTRSSKSLTASIASLATGSSLIVLKRVDEDREYASPVQALMSSILAECGVEMSRDVIRSRATIFLASPQRVTTYHVDADTNFLFQLRGSKDFYVYPDARSFLPDRELEEYFSGNPSAATFRDSQSPLASHYLLDAGSALHIPSLSPHWARSRNDISIALSINFDLGSMETLAQLYRLNHRLRRFGTTPTAPGRSVTRDKAKLALIRVAKQWKDRTRQFKVAGLVRSTI